ncbi:MAG: asparagine--tRNA ligase [Planctomycetota bacterium]|jgi:asparaginyl-tRNA synthetase
MDSKQTYIEDLSRHIDEEVTVKGWLYNRRSSGKVRFLHVRDGTGVLQCVATVKDLDEETFEQLDRLPQESSLEIRGTIREDRRAPGGVEMGIAALKVVHEGEEYPIALKDHGVGFLLDHRHLWIRSRKQAATLRIRHEVIRAIRGFFDERGFICVDTPIFTASSCEETSTLFQVDYFGEAAFLAQSGQLYAEAGAMALGKVYCFGPTFRAEKSKTRRHLTEFWMVEPEVAYADLDDVMDLAEAFLTTIVERVLAHRRRELETLERDTTLLERIRPPFPRITYDEALDILEKKGQGIPWGEDFGAPQETLIGEAFDRPVMVHRYPAAAKAFYMKRDPANPKVSLCVDVIAPEGYGEIIGGSQREDDLAELKARLAEFNLPESAFQWYLDLRRYGTVPHGGFGLGLERTVAWLCGTHHIRETIPFPRMLHRINP